MNIKSKVHGSTWRARSYVSRLDHGDVLIQRVNIFRGRRGRGLTPQVIPFAGHEIGERAVFSSIEICSYKDIELFVGIQDSPKGLAEVSNCNEIN
jgi:hypothetical protein